MPYHLRFPLDLNLEIVYKLINNYVVGKKRGLGETYN